MIRSVLLGGLLAMGLVLPAHGQQAALIRLRLVDDASRAGVSQAEVSVDGDASHSADSTGVVRILVAPGTRTVVARRIGYRSQEVAFTVYPGATMDVEVALRQLSIPIPDLVAVARTDGRIRIAEFHERRDGRSADAEVEGVPPLFAIQAAIPGKGGPEWLLDDQRGGSPRLPCTLHVLVDGQLADARAVRLRMDPAAAMGAYLSPSGVNLLVPTARCAVVRIQTRPLP
jgi:hypothetical protein